jgi:uncharacterized membrane protein YccF (DUF307 family)
LREFLTSAWPRLAFRSMMRLMRMLGNLLWFLLAGIWLAAGYALAGLLLCLTIIGIPFGVQVFKLAGFALWPFGRTVVAGGGPAAGLELLFNVLWLVLFGWAFCVGHLVAGLLLCLTIIGIPFGLQSFKLGGLALWPFGRNIVGSESVRPRAQHDMASATL